MRFTMQVIPGDLSPLHTKQAVVDLIVKVCIELCVSGSPGRILKARSQGFLFCSGSGLRVPGLGGGFKAWGEKAAIRSV